MSIGEFMKEKMVVIISNMLLFIILAVIMITINFNVNFNVNVIIISFAFCIWFLPLISYMALEFIKFKNYYDEINNILENLDKKYLFQR